MTSTSFILSMLLLFFLFAVQSEANARRCQQQALDAYNRGVAKFESGAVRQALDEFEHVVELQPNLIDGHVSAAACSLSMGKRAAAKHAYLRAYRRLASFPPEEHAVLCEPLCRLLLQEAVAITADDGRRRLEQREMTRARRIAGLPTLRDVVASPLLPDASLLNDACMKAGDAALAGKALLLLEREEEAVEHLERALTLNDSNELRNELADAYQALFRLAFLRAEDAPRAWAVQQKALRNRPDDATSLMRTATLARVTLPFHDLRALDYTRQARLTRVREVDGRRQRRRRLVDVLGAVGSERFASVERLLDSTTESYMLANAAGTAVIPLDDGEFVRARFQGQKVALVKFGRGVFMEGFSGVLYDADHVYFSAGSLPVHFTARSSTAVVPVPESVFLVGVGLSALNYYHTIGEGVARLALTLALEPGAKLLLQDSPLWRELVVALALDNDVLWYQPGASRFTTGGQRRYRFDRLSMVVWFTDTEDSSSDAVAAADSWQEFQAPRPALLAARRLVLQALAGLQGPGFGHARRVVYVSRRDATPLKRTVLNEERLIAAIEELVGRHCLTVFSSRQASRTLSFLEQVSSFRSAELVIGPHGAGLTNLLFARENAALLYFPTKPMVDNCFGNIAASLNMSLHPVPSMHAFYRGAYKIDRRRIDDVVKTLGELLDQRAWTRGDVCGNNRITKQKSKSVQNNRI